MFYTRYMFYTMLARKYLASFLGLGVVTLPVVGVTNFAYGETQVVGVKDIPRPDYAPLGGRVGTVIVNPAITFDVFNDDNVFKRAASPKSDVFTVIKPKIGLSMDWNLHQVQIGGAANLGRHKKLRAENYDDYSAFASGRYDLDYGTYILASVNYDWKHEDRGAPDDVNGDTPLTYGVKSSTLGFVRDIGLLNLSISNTYKQIEYDDTKRAGATVDNGDRDRKNTISTVRLGYDLSDDSEVYVSAQYDQQKFAENSSSFRNSDGAEYRAGLRSVLTGKLKGDVYYGRIYHDYNGSVFDDSDAPVFGSSFLWAATGLTSLKLDINRSFVGTTQEGASGLSRTHILLNADHALRPNWFLSANISFDRDVYEGDASLNAARESDLYRGGLGVEYFMNRNVSARVSYDYRRRDYDSDASRDYDSNISMFSIGYTY